MILLICCFYITKVGENPDISKCFENFVYQTLGLLTRFYTAELRYNENQWVLFVKHIDNYIILTNRMGVGNYSVPHLALP